MNHRICDLESLLENFPVKNEPAHGASSKRIKELACFEDLLHFLELLQLSFRLLEFFFLDGDVFKHPVNLVEDDLDRRPLLPRLPRLGRGRAR